MPMSKADSREKLVSLRETTMATASRERISSTGKLNLLGSRNSMLASPAFMVVAGGEAKGGGATLARSKSLTSLVAARRREAELRKKKRIVVPYFESRCSKISLVLACLLGLVFSG